MITPTIDRRLPTRAVRPRVVIITLLIAAGILMVLAALDLSGSGDFHTYKYEIRGTVSSAADGTPLGGVIVWLKLNPLGQATKSANETLHGWVLSEADGSFQMQTQFNSHEFRELPRWVLHLTKDGYAETLVDISQHGEPKSGSSPYLIAVAASMRPGASDAAPQPGN